MIQSILTGPGGSEQPPAGPAAVGGDHAGGRADLAEERRLLVHVAADDDRPSGGAQAVDERDLGPLGGGALGLMPSGELWMVMTRTPAGHPVAQQHDGDRPVLVVEHVVNECASTSSNIESRKAIWRRTPLLPSPLRRPDAEAGRAGVEHVELVVLHLLQPIRSRPSPWTSDAV